MGRPRKQVERICPVCKQYWTATTQYQREVQVYCSRKCRTVVHGNGRKTETVTGHCLQCGCEMQLLPYQVARTKKFCSYSCKSSYHNSGKGNPAWVGGRSRYWKHQARKRDQFTCQYLGCSKRNEGNGTHAHHKLPRSLGGTDALDNFITLCAAHHKEMEWKFLRKIVEQLEVYAPQALPDIMESLYGHHKPVNPPQPQPSF